MEKLPNGSVTIVNLPGTTSILARTWHLYSKHFGSFALFSLLFTLGVAVNAGLGVLLDSIEKTGGAGAYAISRIGITVVNLIVAYYALWIFCGLISFLNELRHGRSVSVSDALKIGSQRLNSVFLIAVLLAFVLYGSLFTGIVFALFSFWYYFALYVAIVDEVHGFDAIAKSRYLTHGLFWKIIGRYIAVVLLLMGFYTIAYLLLAVGGGVGSYLFLAAGAAILFFSAPFFIIYDFIRFIDIAAVERSVGFCSYRGERLSLWAWAIFGAALFLIFWTLGLFLPQKQADIGRSFGLSVTRTLLPVAEQMQRNMETIGDMFGFERPARTPNPQLDELERLLDSDSQPTP